MTDNEITLWLEDRLKSATKCIVSLETQIEDLRSIVAVFEEALSDLWIFASQATGGNVPTDHVMTKKASDLLKGLKPKKPLPKPYETFNEQEWDDLMYKARDVLRFGEDVEDPYAMHRAYEYIYFIVRDKK